MARRLDRLEALAAEIDKAGGTALALDADITDRTQAEATVQQVVERFGRLDTLVNNAGLMLLGPVVGADAQEWDGMIAINIQGLLYTTRAALPHLLQPPNRARAGLPGYRGGTCRGHQGTGGGRRPTAGVGRWVG